jgi:hypothetical protein
MGAALFPLHVRVGKRREVQTRSTRAVMRRFTRVVALPTRKLVISISRINGFNPTGLEE